MQILSGGLMLSLVLFFVLAVEGKPRDIEEEEEEDDDYYNSDEEYRDGDYGDDYNSDTSEREEQITINPKFVTQPSSHTFDKGTTIRLPCFVDQMPKDFVIMWSKLKESGEKDYLALGDSLMKKDDARIKVELNHEGEHIGSTLVIGLAEDSDAGHYLCALGTSDSQEIKHTVHIRAPPSIRKTPSNGLLIAQKGDKITLSCKGKGSPKPKITWTRANKLMPDGSESMEAEELVYHKVNRHHTGTYICSADNGFSAPARDKIDVQVHFAPEIQAEQVYIHAQAGNEVELVCNIHAHPKATVKWFKNSMELTEDKNKLTKHGHKYTLKIREMKESDFGNYTCRAENSKGIASRILEVSGKAGYADFNSARQGNEPDSYLIEWSSESYSELTQFELKVREHGETAWHSFEVRPHRLSSFMYAGKHNLKDLKPATQYEATVAAHNTNGWSRDSPTFHFATFGAEPLSVSAKDGAQSLKIMNDLILSCLTLFLALKLF